MTYNSITLHGMYNVRASVYNYTVMRTADYAYPTTAQVKQSVPMGVLRHETFAMEWASLQNATEYAVSVYAEDRKGVPGDQPIESTTFFITTDAVRCPAAEGWDVTLNNRWGEKACERGWSGAIKRWCDGDGAWGEVVNECGGSGVRE